MTRNTRYWLIFSLCGFIGSLFADESVIGIIGGRKNSAGELYAAFVRADGSIMDIGGLPDLGIANSGIISVSMTRTGIGLLGGGDFSGLQPPYVTLVLPDSTLRPLNGITSSDGFIHSVAINNQGQGIIGGFDDSPSSVGYAAYVSTLGTVQNLSMTLGTGTTIRSVGINKNGVGIVGGGAASLTGAPYAAIISPNGTSVTSLLGAPTYAGQVRAVAINDSNVCLLGGTKILGPNEPYVAVVGVDQQVHELALGPITATVVVDAALNNSGLGFVVLSGGATPYAAAIQTGSLSVNPLAFSFPPVFLGLTAVAVNASGEALIGGFSGTLTPGYLARLDPNQNITMVAGLPNFLQIIDVAINDAGVGLIGGLAIEGVDYTGYSAIIAPNGTVTEIFGDFNSINGAIGAVAMGSAILDRIGPTVFSSNLSIMNTQLLFSYALEAHLTRTRANLFQDRVKDKIVSFLADADENSTKTKNYHSSIKAQKGGEWDLWTAPFGNLVHQIGDDSNPSYKNSAAGFLSGLDYSTHRWLFGCSLGYAYNYFELGSNIGHGDVQEEVLSLYATYGEKKIWVNAALWGGIYQFTNKRFTLGYIPSHGFTKGWICSPHLEIACLFSILGEKHSSLEPFFMVDWVNSWQNGFQESGFSGLNLVMPEQHTSLIRNEIGLRRYETFDSRFGQLVCEEKLSYVNQNPYNMNPVTTSFVAAASSFPVAIGSSRVQNLVGGELHATFFPQNQRFPYLSLDFQGEWGAAYQSYFIGFELGRIF